MLALLKHWQIGVGMVAGAAMAFLPSYYLGRADGKEIARIDTLKHSVTALRERNATDEAIQKLDTGGLCAALGGVFINGTCE